MKYSYLDAVLDTKNISRKELSQAIGLSYGALSKRIIGLIDFKFSEVKEIIEFLKLTDEEIQLIFFK